MIVRWSDAALSRGIAVILGQGDAPTTDRSIIRPESVSPAGMEGGKTQSTCPREAEVYGAGDLPSDADFQA